MAENLPKTGLEVDVIGVPKSVRELKTWQGALGQQNKAVLAASKASGIVNKAFGVVQKDLNGIASRALSAVPGIGKFAGSLTSAAEGASMFGMSMGKALPVIGAAVVAIGAATVAWSAFIKLGTRGAELQNQIQAFGNMVSPFQDATEALQGLRAATRNTVSDAELMRLSVAALQGQSAEFRSVLLTVENGQTNLGRVFDITARAARASGQSVEIVREKFLTGLRLQSRLRLDDIGVTVKAEEANQRYAESLGKTAVQLTEAEKKQAFLNEALRQLDKIGAEAPINRIQDALARIPVVFQNIRDRLALAIQPIFEPLATMVSAIVSAVGTIASYVIPVIATLASVIGAVLSEAIKTAKTLFNGLFGDMASGAGSVIPYVVAGFQLVGEVAVAAIRFVGMVIRTIFTTVIGFAKSVAKSIRKAIGSLFGGVGKDVDLNINQLAYNMGYGGAAVAGAFAGGLLKGGTYVLQAVTEIAQIVADFLMGFSPPKKGVLHNIDRGGENVAIAWSEGFVSGIQKSFGAATQFVNDRLGAIASFSRDQLTAGLARLDLALRPFKESLAIVKADMEAIAGFTDPAMRILERQRTALLKAFGRGENGLDIEALRGQDRQIQRLKELKELGADQVDQAELQLSLAQSQQAQQRALLQIALERMGAEQGAAKAAAEVAKAGGSGAAGGADLGGVGGGFTAGELPDLLSNDAIDAARQKIIAAIGGVIASGSAGFQAGLGDSGFNEALGGFNQQRGALGTQLGRIQEADPVQKIKDKFTGLKDSLTEPLNGLKDSINEAFNNLFGEEGTITGHLNTFKDKMLAIFTGDESPVTLAKNALATTLTEMGGYFMWLKDEVSLKLNEAKGFIEGFFTNEDSPITKAKTAVTDLLNSVINDFLRLTNTGDGTLNHALKGLLDTLRAVLITPFHGALESLANLVADALRSIVNGIGALASVVGYDLPVIPQIAIPFPEMAKGTLGINRPFIAGDAGKELVIPQRNSPLSVFPNKATMALDRIGALMQRVSSTAVAMPSRPAPSPQYINPPSSVSSSSMINSQNRTDNRTINNNFRHKPSKLELMQQRASM